MNAVEAKNLTKKYKDVTAVDSLSLTIGHGEFFALLGQNGAGKTTTVKLLTGLISPDGGDALIMGHSIVKETEKAKSLINVSPQETAVAQKLSVKENLEFIAELYGADKKQAQKKAQESLDSFALRQKENAKVKTLSGGMQRRLSIAMALITEPEILLLDEPTLGLDVKARRSLWKQISSLKGKTTVILTTHYLEEAQALADRIGIMDKGTLRIVDTPDNIIKSTGKDNIEDAFLFLTDTEGDEE
ncbi:MAG: ABC transporter ATP-binding protein [Acutalibacteraceae bacterium]